MTDEQRPGVPPNISIALVGAPQTGKSETARLFAEKVEPELGLFTVLDEFPAEVEEMGLAVGVYGDYRVTNLIHYMRWSYELRAFARGENYITTGTAYESLAHSALLIEMLQEGFQTPETGARVMPEMHAATALSMWLMHTFNYRYGFYIPRATGLEVVGDAGDRNERSFADRIDMAIQVAFARFRVGLERLTGSPEEMADQMADSVLTTERQIKADEHPRLHPDGTFRQEFLDAAREQAERERAEVAARAQAAQASQLDPSMLEEGGTVGLFPESEE